MLERGTISSKDGIHDVNNQNHDYESMRIDSGTEDSYDPHYATLYKPVLPRTADVITLSKWSRTKMLVSFWEWDVSEDETKADRIDRKSEYAKLFQILPQI